MANDGCTSTDLDIYFQPHHPFLATGTSNQTRQTWKPRRSARSGSSADDLTQLLRMDNHSVYNSFMRNPNQLWASLRYFHDFVRGLTNSNYLHVDRSDFQICQGTQWELVVMANPRPCCGAAPVVMGWSAWGFESYTVAKHSGERSAEWWCEMWCEMWWQMIIRICYSDWRNAKWWLRRVCDSQWWQTVVVNER